jgi:hypothetical protein
MWESKAAFWPDFSKQLRKAALLRVPQMRHFQQAGVLFESNSTLAEISNFYTHKFRGRPNFFYSIFQGSSLPWFFYQIALTSFQNNVLD